MDKNTGGPAFPIGSGDMRDPQGMTLRDYFAAKAVVGLLTMADEWRSYFRRDGDGTTWKDEAAKAAYEVADAMLRAREST
jgi:hypothetical protein